MMKSGKNKFSTFAKIFPVNGNSTHFPEKGQTFFNVNIENGPEKHDWQILGGLSDIQQA